MSRGEARLPRIRALALPALLALLSLGIAVGSDIAMTELAGGARAHAAGAAGAAGAAEPEPGPLRVMVEGDSISQGFAGDHTWRYWLAEEFRKQGVPLQMVGPYTTLRDGTERYLVPFDQRAHASRSGSTIDWHLSRAREWVATYQPDVVVIELGTNDIIRGDDAATVAAQTESLVRDEIWAARPGTRVKIVEVPGRIDPARDEIAAASTALIRATFAGDPLVSVVRLRGRAPRMVDWSPRAHTWDGLHPNVAGQRLLAQRVAEWFYYDRTLPAYPTVRPTSQWVLGITPRPTIASRSAFRVPLGTTAERFSLTTLRCEARRLQWSRRARAFVPVRTYWSPVLAGWSLAGTTDPARSCLIRGLPRGRYQVRLRSSRLWAVASPTPWVSILLR